MVDDVFNQARRFNLKVLLRFVAVRTQSKIGGLVTDNERMRSHDGDRRPSLFADVWQTSFDSESATLKQEAFVRKVLLHIKSRPQDAALLMGVSVTPNGLYEGEYVGTNRLPGPDQTDYAAQYDYSEVARQGFIRRMKIKYGDNLVAANGAWGQSFRKWEDVSLPVPYYEGRGVWSFSSTYTQDFLYSKSLALAEWLQRMTAVTRSISPRLLAYTENGSLQDPASVSTRASFLLPAITDFVDARKQNGTPEYPHLLSAQISRMGGKLAMEEFFTNRDFSTEQPYTTAEMVKHATQAFNSGCFVVVSAGIEEFEDKSKWDPYIGRVNAAYEQLRPLLNQPVPAQTNAAPFTVTAKQVLSKRDWWSFEKGPSLRSQYETQANGTLLPIVLINNLNER